MTEPRKQGIFFKRSLATAALLVPLVLAGCSHPTYYAPPPPPPPPMDQIAQQGFHDGMEAARRDIAEGRPPEVNRHPRFRNPPVPPPAVEDYRHAFRSGYDEVYRHGPTPPPPPPGY